ncbi:MAG: DUF3179 domain-containing protein [Pseudomonadota bacterium]
MMLRSLVCALPWLIVASLALAEVPRGWLAEWPRTDFTRTAVDLDEIMSGGPPKDGIPAIDDPRFAAVDAVSDDLAPSEPVMSVTLGGDARAYPLRVLMWHEIVNDTVGGLPLAITYCPLCNSGIVFERTVDGEVTTFGTTGKLRHSDLVMYDRATESWWQQFEGRAIVGARTGTDLERVPARLEAFADFARRHPDGRVLVPSNPAARDYGRNPYVGYDTAPRPFLFDGSYDGPGSPLMRVVAIEDADRAFSLPLVRRDGEITHGAYVIRWRPGQNSALDAAEIARGRDIGTVTVQRRHADGRLEDAVYDVPFAFAFRAFHPDRPILHTE